MRMLRGLTVSAVLGLGLAAAPDARAAFIATMTEIGSDVVISGSGTINTAGFISPGFAMTGAPPGVLAPTMGLMIGVQAVAFVDYYAPFTGPSGFGGGDFSNPTSGSGDRVGLRTDLPGIAVPLGYSSGDFLVSSSTYAGATFASLGVTLGTYVWNWGSGPTADSFTLIISSDLPVPEPASVVLLATAIVALGLKRRRKVG